MDGLGAQRAFEAAADNEHGSAVREGPQCEHEACVLARRSAETVGQALAHEIERGPGLMQRRRFGHAVEEDFVGMSMPEGKLKVALDGLAKRAGAAEHGEKIFSGLQAESFQDVVAVAVALVDGGGGGAGGLGHGTHGQRLFAAASPQARGGVEDTLFQVGIGMTGQISSTITKLLLAQRIVNAVYFTYTQQLTTSQAGPAGSEKQGSPPKRIPGPACVHFNIHEEQ